MSGAGRADRAAAVLAALLLLNYLLWLVFPGAAGGAAIAVALSGVATAGYLALEVSARRIFVAAVIGAGFLLLFFEPITAWDARSIWFFHAKRMFFDGSIAARLDNYPEWSRAGYPDLVPAAAASIATLFGVWNEVLPKVALLLALAPPIVVLMSRCVPLPVKMLMIGSIVLVARDQLLNGYMDAHLALYVAAAAVLTREAMAMRFPPAHFTPAFVLLGCAAAIKDEGIVMALLLLAPLALLLHRTRARGAELAKAVSVAAFAGLPILLWKLQVSAANIPGLADAGALARGGSRLAGPEPLLIFSALLSETRLALVALLLLALLVGKLERVLWYFVVGYLTVLFVVYMTTPYDVLWQLSTSVDRVTLVVRLLVAIVLVLELQRWLQRREPL